MAEKTINGRDFRVDQLLATHSLLLQAKIMQVLGTAVDQLPAVFAGAGDQASPEQKEKSNIAAIKAFADIFQKSEPERIVSLVKEIIGVAYIKRPSGNYDKIEFDNDFSGSDMKSMIPVAVFVLRETFGDFFSGFLANGIPGNQEKASPNDKSKG